MNRNSFLFRQMMPDDLEAWRRLRTIAWQPSAASGAADSPVVMAQEVFVPAVMRWVEYRDQRIGAVRFDEGEESITLADLFLHPAHQGRGLGSHVVRRLGLEAARRGKPIELEDDSDGAAARFLERAGFVRVDSASSHFRYRSPRAALVA